jgi:beta-lactamase class A
MRFFPVLTLTLIASTAAAGTLEERIAAIAKDARGRVGIAAVVLETSESVRVNASEPYPMQSVYKLPIAMAVLQQVDRGTFRLDQKVEVTPADFVTAGQHSPLRDQHPNGVTLSLEELLRLNVAESDGTACDVLLDLIGGPDKVMQYQESLGVTGIKVVDSEKAIGRNHSLQYRNSATPDQAVKLLRALHEGAGLSKSSQALVLRMMLESPTGPQRLRGLLPKNANVAHKTGSSGMEKGIAAATNDIGIITLPNGRHLIIAVFVSDARAKTEDRERVIARVAKLLWDEWGR